MLTMQSALSPSVSAAACQDTGFLTFPTWYRGVATTDAKTGSCVIKAPDSKDQAGLSKFIWRIVLNIIEIATQLVAYIALFYVFYGGFQYLTSSGNPDQASNGRSTILNAIIGIVIATGASAIVNTLGVVTDNTSSVPAVIGNVLKIVYFLAGTIAVFSLVISGYKFVAGGSDPKTVEKARNTILYSVIGLILVASAFAITQFVIDRVQ